MLKVPFLHRVLHRFHSTTHSLLHSLTDVALDGMRMQSSLLLLMLLLLATMHSGCSSAHYRHAPFRLLTTYTTTTCR